MKASETLTRQPSKRNTKPSKPTAYQFSVVIEPDEEGYHVFVPALPGCHSFGETIDEARKNIIEAIELHVDGLVEHGLPVPVDRVVTDRLVFGA